MGVRGIAVEGEPDMEVVGVRGVVGGTSIGRVCDLPVGFRWIEMSGSGGKGSVSPRFARLLRLGRRPKRFLVFVSDPVDIAELDMRVSDVLVEGVECAVDDSVALVVEIEGPADLSDSIEVDDGGSGNIVNETIDPADGAVPPEAKD